MTAADRAPDGFAVAEPETVQRIGSDGTHFAVDVYRPIGAGPAPALLMRQPYGRKIASAVVLAHPAWYAARGYVVVIEDVRGRGNSGGDFRVLADDVVDGAEALAWAADLAGTTGQVATYGFSYQAINQFLGLAGARRAGTKRPDAFFTAMAPWSVRNDWVTEGDAFRLALNQGWATQVAAETARLAGNAELFAALAAINQGGGAPGSKPGRPPHLPKGRAPHYDAWLADDAGAFDAISPATQLAGDPLDVPGLHIGGWNDIMLTGTLAAYDAFSAAGRARQHLLVGPWLHIPWSRSVGALDLGPAAASSVDDVAVGFFDHALKGRGEPAAPVRLFDTGVRRWCKRDADWRAPGVSWFLTSSGLAATRSTDGGLAPSPHASSTDHLVHDPWRPAPSIGGHLPPSPGYVDRAAIDERTDVATYTTAPFAEALILRGDVRAVLAVTSDRPSFDLGCTLSIVAPDGARAMTLTSGYRTVSAAPDGAVTIAMRAVCCTVPAGYSLRLSVQAAAYPAFAVNPGTGQRAVDAAGCDALVTTLVIATGPEAGSRIELPIAQPEAIA